MGGMFRGVAMAASDSPWLYEGEAAEYCRCSTSSLREMRLPASDSGGRKVYHRASLDAAILSRQWQRSTNAGKPTTSTGVRTGSSFAGVSERLTGKRLRPFVARKQQNSQAS